MRSLETIKGLMGEERGTATYLDIYDFQISAETPKDCFVIKLEPKEFHLIIFKMLYR